jgi:hypothetical protein
MICFCSALFSIGLGLPHGNLCCPPGHRPETLELRWNDLCRGRQPDRPPISPQAEIALVLVIHSQISECTGTHLLNVSLQDLFF